MFPITFITADSPAWQHAALDALLSETFGFTFEPWRAEGLWTADYQVATILDDKRLLASVGVWRMDMRVHGQPRVWRQIGAVATRPEVRGQGLSRALMDAVLAQAPDEPLLLWANESVREFYPRFGFQPASDRQPVLDLAALRQAWTQTLAGGKRPAATDSPTLPRLPRWLIRHKTGLRRMKFDDPGLMEYIHVPSGDPNRLACDNPGPVRWFNIDLTYRDCLYEIPALRTLLVVLRNERTLTLLDVATRPAYQPAGSEAALSPTTPTAPLAMSNVLPYLDLAEIDEVRFAFNPSGIDHLLRWADYDQTGARLFMRGDLRLAGDYILPWMLRT